ncbi:Putative Holliday junction resolvase [Liberibacter crescens BT-1]|uniref:Putative pre-16S rRNA nuclease n=1 Tax=Liberibacter crescens (strain BT-1) TaxID=1215343 RepID=L0EWE6_LIBCB|nr:Holliday junction resolvase RuvX [Liberibacter crescens]AGA64973.1 Putative Holliday junction resolvase [Liberibacter crescens BT-1]AMC12992.1 Holliday junction resolvase [Liberibacter crescens]
MTTIFIEELSKILKPKQPIAGIDLGTKTIGMSISDLSQRIASPRPFIKRKKFTQDADILLAFAKIEKISAFIIGLPINMNGSEGPRAQATRDFVKNMNEKTDIPFIFWDERLSTVAAKRMLINMDISRKKQSEKIDSIAATLILQTALDRIFLLTTTKT